MADTLTLLNAVGFNAALAPPIFVATQNGTQSVPTGFGGMALSLATPAIDSYNGWASGQPTRYTPQVPGWYLAVGQVVYSASTTGSRLIQVLKNGSTNNSVGVAAGAPCPTTSYNTVFNCSGIQFFNGTSDYMEVWAYQDTGAALNTNGGNLCLSVVKLHM